MKKRALLIGLSLAALTVVVGFVVSNPVPVSEVLTTLTGDSETLNCVQAETGDCLTMPTVSGFTINSTEIAFPDAFEADYQLIVMPFDREQQVLAVTWLPLFQELATENDNLQFWSIAALPELNSAIRLLVLGGISAAVTDTDVRTQITALFLEEQAQFLEVLDVDTIDEIRVFITDADGVVYYADSGAFTEESGNNLRDALHDIIGD